MAAANALFNQFAGQSVQFVWITEEKDSSLVDWLANYPLKGFVLLDSTGITGRSYGLELPATVFIGADEPDSIGFYRPAIPATDTLKAVLRRADYNYSVEARSSSSSRHLSKAIKYFWRRKGREFRKAL